MMTYFEQDGYTSTIEAWPNQDKYVFVVHIFYPDDSSVAAPGIYHTRQEAVRAARSVMKDRFGDNFPGYVEHVLVAPAIDITAKQTLKLNQQATATVVKK